MGQAEQATNRANQATQQAQGGFNALGGAIKGAIGAIALNQVIGFAEDMNRLGTEVRANRAIFDQLTESMGGQDRVIRSLRESTGGVVDDLTLMGAANQLLRLNIVDNTDDLDKLVGQIQRLKDPTESTTDAIRNFALMLSNESLLRLDSFGISSAAVKKSMDELGLSFREAVQIEMDKQIERLGDAANVSETALAKLQTRIANFTQQAGENIATGVEATINLVDAYTQYTQRQVDIGERSRALMASAGLNVSDFSTYAEYEQFGKTAVNIQDQLAYSILKVYDAARRGAEGIHDYYQQQQRMTQAAEDAATLRAPLEQQLSMLNYLLPDGGTPFNYLTAGQNEYFQGVFTQIQGQIKQTREQFKDILTDADTAALDAMEASVKGMANEADRAAKAFERMSLADIFGTSSGGILGEITDDLLAAGQAAGWSKDKLNEYKDALDLVSGRQTPMSQAYQDQLIPALMNLSPEDAARAAQNFEQSMRIAAENNVPFSNLNQFGLQSFAGLFGSGGQQITVNPGDNLYALAGRYGGNWQDYQSLLTNGILRTGNYDIGGGSLMDNFDPASFMQSIMGTLNMTVGEQGSFGMGGLGTAMQDAEDSASQIDIYMTNIGDSISTFTGNLEGAFSKTYTLNLDVVANLPDWLKAAIHDGTSLVELVGDAIRINGGVTPGATSSTPRAGRFQATE